MVEALSTIQPTTDTAPNYCPVGSHSHQTWAEGKLACNLQRVKVKKKRKRQKRKKRRKKRRKRERRRRRKDEACSGQKCVFRMGTKHSIKITVCEG